MGRIIAHAAPAVNGAAREKGDTQAEGDLGVALSCRNP
jgi:hypothetical protein